MPGCPSFLISGVSNEVSEERPLKQRHRVYNGDLKKVPQQTPGTPHIPHDRSMHPYYASVISFRIFLTPHVCFRQLTFRIVETPTLKLLRTSAGYRAWTSSAD